MKLRDCLISDRSDLVIDGSGEEVVGFHVAVERKLASIRDPEISWRMETGETGFFGALLGKRRDLLVIENKKFPEYAVLVAARAHGTALHVVWMLLIEPRFAKDVRRALRLDAEPGTRFEVGSELDAIDLMDLRAFLGITRLVFKDAIRALTDHEPEEDADTRYSEDVE